MQTQMNAREIELRIYMNEVPVGMVSKTNCHEKWRAVFTMEPETVEGTGCSIDDAIQHALKNGRESFMDLVNTVDDLHETIFK